MKRLDAWAINECGIPALLLMENAGGAVANKVKSILGNLRGKQVIVLAGKGNNGGDALVAARLLQEMGAEVRLFLLYSPELFNGAALENWRLLERLGIKYHLLNDENSLYLLKLRLNQCDLVVDGIYGTGFHGSPEKSAARVIQAVNESAAPVIAIDIPSGLEADTGRVGEACIKADYTVTFAWAKRGLVLFPGRIYVGELEVACISIPQQGLKQLEKEEYYVDAALARGSLPPRDREGHKNSFGHVLVIAGSAGMTGAAYLACKAGLRAGAGMVTACLPGSLAGYFDASLPEVITKGVVETEARTIDSAAWPQIEQLLKNKKSIVFGPGLTTEHGIRDILEKLLSNTSLPLVIDADGLNVLSGDPETLKSSSGPVVLTPHPGEMARLMGIPAAKVQENRVETAREAASRFNAVVVLKGAATVTAEPQGTVYINSTGGPALATAGTGDVLAGAIGGLLAQGLEPAKAAFLGAYIHGLAGDLAAQEKGIRGVIASDVLEKLPLALKTIENED
jgi:NAD(P)H-hydrate epimerase